MADTARPSKSLQQQQQQHIQNKLESRLSLSANSKHQHNDESSLINYSSGKLSRAESEQHGNIDKKDCEWLQAT